MAVRSAGLLYGLFYLYAIGDLSLSPLPAWSLSLSDIPLQQALQTRAPLLFEGIGVAHLGAVVWLISPLNLIVAATLGGLLSVNGAQAVRLAMRPRACDTAHAVRPARGLLGSALPALLGGGACCAPGLLLLLGIPGLGALAGLFAWLVPLSVLLLLMNLLWQRRQLRDHAASGA